MRAALAGLTTRGRSFLAAGTAATVCALLLGERDLLRVGVFLLCLPLVAAGVVARTRYRLNCNRSLEPRRVVAGQAAHVLLRLDNVSRLPTGVLLVEDTLPYVLGGRPRFVLDRVEPHGVREVTYAIRADVRGRYPVGPLSVRLTDPFGLVELSRSFVSVDHMVVTPSVSVLPGIRLGGEWSGGGESRARSVATAGEDDVATREYRQGDDLRRVHWRSTARYGELMVRREEQPWQSRGTLLLDSRAVAHRGDGPGSSFEWAVSATASIGLHLIRNGYNLRFLTESGEDLSGFGGVSDVGGGAFEGLLLDTLAVARTSPVHDLTAVSQQVRRGGGEGLLVAVLGSLTAEDAESLARLRHGSAACVGVLVRTAEWATLSPRFKREAEEAHGAAARLLHRAGWRVLSVPHGASLATLWPQAAAGSPMAAIAEPPALSLAGTEVPAPGRP